MRRRPTRRLVGVALIAATGAVVSLGALGLTNDASAPDEPVGGGRAENRGIAVKRGCALEKEWLLRIWRGQAGERSPDVILVPKEPNYFGGFLVPNHSGPWDYLQRVPLVLYGPGNIAAQGRPLHKHASVTDVYPTIGRLAQVSLPERSGRVLEDALVPGATPELVMVIVWDGTGRNVLERWPGGWPNLARMERQGTSYLGATVGSSPSITPATHSSLGTGTFPRSHGVPAIYYRESGGRIKEAFFGADPTILRTTTFSDDVDQAYENRSRVGALFWSKWHLGLLGHGQTLSGGDRDELAIIRHDGDLGGNPDTYSLPDYIELPTFDRIKERVDRADGVADGKWLGHEFDKINNPAWVEYHTDVLLSMLRERRYGDGDGVPDIFLTNFKMTDIAGHKFFMNSKEMAAVLRAQDAALGKIRSYLDRRVKDYVIIVTADHGHTPSPDVTGAWPISANQIAEDVDERFGVPEGRSLVVGSKAAGLFLDFGLMNDLGITGSDVAAFLNRYSIRDNWADGRLPEGYENRGGERVLDAAFTRRQLPAIMRCAFGSRQPPASLRG